MEIPKSNGFIKKVSPISKSIRQLYQATLIQKERNEAAIK